MERITILHTEYMNCSELLCKLPKMNQNYQIIKPITKITTANKEQNEPGNHGSFNQHLLVIAELHLETYHW